MCDIKAISEEEIPKSINYFFEVTVFNAVNLKANVKSCSVLIAIGTARFETKARKAVNGRIEWNETICKNEVVNGPDELDQMPCVVVEVLSNKQSEIFGVFKETFRNVLIKFLVKFGPKTKIKRM